MIIRAAIEVFSESNYRVATISDIAERSGITDPMIYKIFKSKKSLFLEILLLTSRTSFGRLKENTLANLDSIQCKESLRAVLEKTFLPYLKEMEKYRKELKVFYQATSEIDDPDVKKVIRDTYQMTISFYQDLFQLAIERKILDKDTDSRVIALEILGFIIQQNTLFLAGFYNEKDLKTLLLRQIHLWVM